MIELVTKSAIIFAFSFTISGLIYLSRIRLFDTFRRRQDDRAKQASHFGLVPRIGGIAIVTALVLGALMWFKDPTNTSTYARFLLTLVPIFFVGLLEDLGYFTSPRARLLAAAVSGAFYVLLFQQWLPRVDIPGIDWLLGFSPFAIPFSIFAAVGVSHAFNLIDGLNGLASGTAVAAALALAIMAHNVGLVTHRDALLLLVVAISGFLALNFPFGLIFLGDGGAYAIGHVLVWVGITMVWDTPRITAFAVLLVFFWPVADTLLAMSRRALTGKAVGQPDRLHFHQLAMRSLEILLIGRNRRELANPLTTVILLPLIVAPMVVGVFLAQNARLAALAAALFAASFVLKYFLLLRFVRKHWYRGRNRRR